MLTKNKKVISQIIELLKKHSIPKDIESSSDAISHGIEKNVLANAYLGIVAICHQTTPIGERAFRGKINGEIQKGWDYLKNKFLVKIREDERWADFKFWNKLSPKELSLLYEDSEYGLTLNVSARSGAL